MNKGKLIVIEGLDGSGKETQTKILEKRLTALNLNAIRLEFPNYAEQSSALVKMYLSGELSSDPHEINAYAASSFYAVDRVASFMKHWGKNYQKGEIIICDRYTTSNAIFQMTKLDYDKYDKYLRWLWDYEYEKLNLPAPDLVIYLDMSSEASEMLLQRRYNGDENRRDIHEKNRNFLAQCRKTADYAASKCGWKRIQCSSGSEPLSVDEISERIFDSVKEVIS